MTTGTGTKLNHLNYKLKKKCWQRTHKAEKKKLTALEKRQLEIAKRRARIEKRKKNKKNLKAKIKARFVRDIFFLKKKNSFKCPFYLFVSMLYNFMIYVE